MKQTHIFLCHTAPDAGYVCGLKMIRGEYLGKEENILKTNIEMSEPLIRGKSFAAGEGQWVARSAAVGISEEGDIHQKQCVNKCRWF